MTAENRETAPNKTIGVLYREESGRGLTHPYFSLILSSLRQETDERGYDLTFISDSAGDEPGGFAEHCRRHGVDGVCLVCADFASPRIKALIESGLPCITIDHIFKRVPAVLSDNETGVQKLVEYAVGKGHRRIALIHGQNNSIVTRTRISQFHSTMAFSGLEVPEGFVREGRYHDIPLTRDIVRELLTLPDRPTCILLPDDMTYFGAQEAAWSLGMSIPEDISFAGYDGIPMAQALKPPLTTIHQNSDRLGQVAAQRLIELIERPETASRKSFIFPIELYEGGTVA